MAREAIDGFVEIVMEDGGSIPDPKPLSVHQADPDLAGAVWAALGLGIFTKLLEGWAGAVIAKIAVLVFIIIFIQKRPQGIFALKGRVVE